MQLQRPEPLVEQLERLLLPVEAEYQADLEFVLEELAGRQVRLIQDQKFPEHFGQFAEWQSTELFQGQAFLQAFAQLDDPAERFALPWLAVGRVEQAHQLHLRLQHQKEREEKSRCQFLQT
jgi:hypothetical protein